MKRALACTERWPDTAALGAVYSYEGIFWALLRDARAVAENSQALRRIAANQPVWTGLADIRAGKALMLQGKWQEGSVYLRKGIAFAKRVGLFVLLRSHKLDEAEFLASQGQIGDSLALLDEAIADKEYAHLRTQALRQRANLLADSGAQALTVEAAYSAAVECARDQGAKYFELLATTSFAQWLKSQNRGAEARAMLSEIYNCFAEGFDIFALREARSLLDEL